MWRPRLTPRACLLKLSGLPRAGHPARGAVLAAARSAPVFLSGDFKPVETVGAQKHEMDHHRQQEQEHALRHEHAARIEDQPDLVEFSHLSFPPQNHGNQMKVAICATTATSVNSQRPLIYTECSSWACSSVRPVNDRSDLSAMNFPPERYADAAAPRGRDPRDRYGPSGSVRPFGQAALCPGPSHSGSDRENHRRDPVRLEPGPRQRAVQVERPLTDHVAHPPQRCEGDREKEDAEEIQPVLGAAATRRTAADRSFGTDIGHWSGPPSGKSSVVERLLTVASVTRASPRLSAASSALSRNVLAAEMRVSTGCVSTIRASAALASASQGRSRRSGVGVAAPESISLPSGRM